MFKQVKTTKFYVNSQQPYHIEHEMWHYAMTEIYILHVRILEVISVYRYSNFLYSLHFWPISPPITGKPLEVQSNGLSLTRRQNTPLL